MTQNFFSDKLDTNNTETLTEDLELPPKQRPTTTRPRLPASGKIPPQPQVGSGGGGGVNVSPQKRPLPSSGGGGQNASSKPAGPGSGPNEPSKKKVKKNSGAAMAAPEGEGTGEGVTGGDGVDGVKAAGIADGDMAAMKKGGADGTEEMVDAKNGGDGGGGMDGSAALPDLG